MVAVVAGNGLGLGNSSLTQLGQGFGGQAGIGQAGVGQYVNVANGNLVLRNPGQSLVFDGMSLDMLRTYNSQGQMSGDNGWLFGFGRQISGLTGTLNTAGSTVTRTADDGSAVTYAYDPASGDYVSQGQSGAEDTLHWDATAGGWQWTDGATHNVETYDSAGRLASLTNPQTGASFTFSWQGNQLTQVTAGDGDTLALGYDAAGHLTSLAVSEVPPGGTVAVVRQQASYSYDASGRLTSVATTLASDTDTAGGTYTTTYTYDGNSDRVASMTQSDGTTVAYAYSQDGDGNYRVSQITTGTGADAQTVNIAYGNGSTTVTDALGNAWTYAFNAAGELTGVTAPAVAGNTVQTSYAYDANGNVTRFVDAAGGVTDYAYDAHGNLTSVEDASGDTVTYTYDANDNMLSRTVYSTAAQGEVGTSGYVPPSGAQTTHYVYDEAGRLAYVIDGTGAVTRNTYTTDASGNTVLASTFAWRDATFVAGAAEPSLTDMAAWEAGAAAAAGLASGSRVDYSYDARGQVATKTAYDAVDASGEGVIDAGTVITSTTYDASGRLLQSATVRGSARDVVETTSYAYDGIGRIMSSTDALGHTTTYVYLDNDHTIEIIDANGLMTTQVRNSAGLIVSSTQSTGTPPLAGQTFYDAAGHAVASVDAQGRASFTFYDAAGHTTATIDVDGHAIAYTYDAQGNLLATVSYATAVDTSGWLTSSGPTAALPAAFAPPAATTSDTVSLAIFDAQGNQVATVDTNGMVTITTRDTDGNALSVTAYAAPLTASQVTSLGVTPTLAALQAAVTPSAQDKQTITVFDASDRPVVQIDATGVVTINTYDANGELVGAITYANALTASQIAGLGALPTLASIQALLVPSADDRKSLWIRDAQGNPLATVDSTGQVTLYAYDASGNLTATTALSRKLSVDEAAELAANPTYGQLTGIAGFDAVSEDTVITLYDSDGRVAATVSYRNVELMSYDADGNLIGTTTYVTYDQSILNRVAADPTLASLNAALAAQGASSSSQINVYDASGRITASIDGNGYVTLTTYSPDGSWSYSVGNNRALQPAQVASLGATPTLDAITALLDPAQSVPRSVTYFDANGRVILSAGTGHDVFNAYDDAGQLRVTATGPQNVVLFVDADGPLPFATAVPQFIPQTLNFYDAQGNLQAKITTSFDYNPDDGFNEHPDLQLSTTDPVRRITVESQYNAYMTQSAFRNFMTDPTFDALLGTVASVGSNDSSATFYDADGRMIGTLRDQNLVTYTYDASGRLTVSQLYRTNDYIDTSSVDDIPDLDSIVATDATANGTPTLFFYADDATGTTRYSVDDQAISIVRTDLAGNVVFEADFDTGLSESEIYTLVGGSASDVLSAINGADPAPYNVQAYNSNGDTVVYYNSGDLELDQFNTAGQAVSEAYYSDFSGEAINQFAITGDVAALNAALDGVEPDESTLYVLDTDGNIQAIVNSYGEVTLARYDAKGNLVGSIYYPDGLTEEQFASLGPNPGIDRVEALLDRSSPAAGAFNLYDDQGHLIASADASGNLTTMLYDADGNLLSTIKHPPLTTQQVIELAYAPSMQAIEQDIAIDSGARVEQSIRDSSGRITATIDADGNVQTLAYDAQGRVVSVTDYATPLASGFGIIANLEVLDSELQHSAADRISRTIYDNAGHPVAAIDPDGLLTVTTYDAQGNASSSVSYATPLTRQQLASLGNSPTLAQVLQIMGGRSDHTLHDAAGRPVATIDAQGRISYAFYDERGEVVASVDPNGVLTTYQYDANGDVVASTSFATTVDTSNWIDSTGQLNLPTAVPVVEASAADRTTLTVRDADGRAVAQVDATGSVTRWSYGGAGQVVATSVSATQLTSAQRVALGDAPTLAMLDAAVPPSADDRTVRTVYDADGRVAASIDAAGYVTVRTFDAAGNVVATRAYASALTSAQIAALGSSPTLASLLSAVQPTAEDLVTRSFFDGLGRPVATIDADGYVTTWSYDETTHTQVSTRHAMALDAATVAGLPNDASAADVMALLGSDAGSQSVTDTYDADGELVSHVDVTGARTDYTYDVNGRQTGWSTTDGYNTYSGKTTYDAFGDVVSRTDGVGDVTRSTWDSTGRLLSTTDAAGNTTWYFYDAVGRLAYQMVGQEGDDGYPNGYAAVTAITYDAFGDVAQRHTFAQLLPIDPAGLGKDLYPDAATTASIAAAVQSSANDDVLRYTYDGAGRVASMTDGDGFTTSYSYDAFGELASTSRQLSGTANDTTTYAYDSRGEQVGTTEGSGTSLQRTVVTAYDAFGRATSVTDAAGNTVTYSYDRLGRQIAMAQWVDGSVVSAGASYDAFNRVVTQTDALGNVTTFTYDTQANSVTVTTPEGVSVTTARDALGDIVSITDAQGNATTYTYDGDGRLVSTTDALGNVDTVTYGAGGSTVITSGAHGSVEVDYDGQGRVVWRAVDPDGANLDTSYSYDGVGRVLYQYDPDGMTTEYAYDADGRVVSQTQSGDDATSITTTFSYDGEGHVLSTTVGKGGATQSTAYVYDTLGRLVSSTVDPAGLALQTTYAYDADDNLVRSTDPMGNQTWFVHDEAGHTVYTVSPTGAQGADRGLVSHTVYDADGNVVSITTYSQSIDMAELTGLLSGDTASGLALGSSVAAEASGAADTTTSYVRDADGRIRFSVDPTGMVTETRYDSLGHVAAVLAYTSPIATAGGLAADLASGQASVANITSALAVAGDDDTTARATYTYYDADGRVAYTAVAVDVDGQRGYLVTGSTYTPDGQLQTSTLYAAPLTLADLGEGSTTETIAAALAIANSGDDIRTTTYVYDSALRHAATIGPDGSASFIAYDQYGNVAQLIDADGGVIAYTYDGMGRVVEEQHWTTTIDTSSWLSDGQLTEDYGPYFYNGDDNQTDIFTTYDAAGRVATVMHVEDRDGEEGGTFTYTAETDTYDYDQAGRLADVQTDASYADSWENAFTTPTYRETRYFYDADGHAIATLDANGTLTVNTFDAAGRITGSTVFATPTDPDLGATGTLAQLMPAATAADETTTYFRDDLGRTVASIDATGYLTAFTYDLEGRLSASVRYGATVPEEARSSAAAALASVSGSGSQSSVTTYDGFGQVTSTTNAEGSVTTYAYDISGHVTQVVEAAGTEDARTTSSSYDALGELVSTTDAAGATSRFTYDVNGRAVTVTDAMGNTTWSVYDAVGNVIYTVKGMAGPDGQPNAFGEATYMEYDGRRDMTYRVQYAALLTIDASFQPTLDYLDETTGASADDSDLEQYFEYDSLGNVASTDNDVTRVYYTYDGFGELLEQDNGNGARTLDTTYTYDALGHKVQQHDHPQFLQSLSASVALSESFETTDRDQSWTYDAFGNVGSYTDAMGSTTTYRYDGVGELTGQSESVDGQIRDTNTVYDAFGRVTSRTDALGLTTTFAYDDATRSVVTTSPGGLVTTTTHNREGQVITLVDAAGSVTSYQYDADGRLLKTVQPDGSEISGTYDLDGNLLTSTDADGHVVAYTYDAAGRVLTQTVDPDGLNLVTTYTYAGNGLEAQMVDATGTVTNYLHNSDGQVSEMTVTSAADAANGDSPHLTVDYFYDGMGHLQYENEEVGHPQSRALDSAGIDVEQIYEPHDAYGQLMETDADGVDRTYGYDANGNLKVSSDGLENTYYFYNEANQLEYKITPGPGVSDDTIDVAEGYTYDADGNLTSTTAYATPFSQSVLQEAIDGYSQDDGEQLSASEILASIHGALASSPFDRTNYRVYDDQGRLAYTIDSAGVVTETRYNALGQPSQSLVYPNSIGISAALASSLASGSVTATQVAGLVAAAGNTEAGSRETQSFYDTMGRLVFSVVEGTLNGQRTGIVTELHYDADGNVVATIEHDVALTAAQLATATTASLTAWAVASPAGRSTHTVFDAAGRPAWVVDALGNVQHTIYDGDGRVVSSYQYAHPIAPSDWTEASVAAAVAAANPAATDVHGTDTVYDGSGQVLAIYALGNDQPIASYTYDARGDRTSYTDGNGDTWSYDYEDGMLQGEGGPDLSITYYDDQGQPQTTGNAVRIEYERDEAGRITTTITHSPNGQTSVNTSYDAAGNVVSTSTYVRVYDPASGQFESTSSTLQTAAVYNAFGEQVSSTDGDGNTTYHVYDQAGHLAYDVDADGYVTGYGYDAFGDVTSTTRYARPLVLQAAVPNGGPLDLAALQGHLVTDAGDRTVSTTYDGLGRKIAVTQNAVTYANPDGSLATGVPTTRFTYDVHGQLTSTSVLIDGAADQPGAVWATTYNFYDAAGHQTMAVDPMGYVTTWTYDGFGAVLSETDFASPIATSGIVAGGNPPSLPVASATDRSTTYTYDQQGRKASESALRDYTDASGTTVHGYVTTTYGYDNDDHVTSITEGGRTITTTYDAEGRVLTVSSPAERVLVANWKALLADNPSWDLTTDALYTTSSQLVIYAYDAAGNKVQETQWSTAGGPRPTTWYRYDDAGRLVATVTSADAGNPDWTSTQAVNNSYDAAGNLLQSVAKMTDQGGDGSVVTVTTTNIYDDTNRLVSTSVVRSNGTDADTATTSTYNAFGEVVATGDGISTKSTSVYDNAGRLISAVDPKTGVVHTYSYDLAGNLVRDSSHATGGAEVYTQYTRDLDGHVLSQLAPSTTSATGESATAITATYDRWGNVLSSTDANGNTTTYTYNERNQVVTTSGPMVNVVDDGGNAIVMAPSKTTSYDADGNVVAVSDENGNVTRTVYDAAGQVIDVIDAAGSHTRVAYDELGNEVAGETGASGDGTLHITFKDVDSQGRVVDEGDFQLSDGGASQVATLRQVYVLDEAGNRVIVYDGLGSAAIQAGDPATAALHANYYSYDSQGRVIRSQDGAQRAASLDNANNTLPPPLPLPRNLDLEAGSLGWADSVDAGVDPTTFPGWTFVDGTAVYNGSRATEVGSDLYSQDKVPVSPGQVINAWADVYSTGDHGGANVFIYWYAADGSFISKTNSDNVQTTEEGRGMNTVSATAPPGAAFAAIGVNCTNYGEADQINTVYGVGWDYAPPDGQLSPGLDGSIFVNLPTGTFSLQPLNPDFENGDSGWDKTPGWQITGSTATANGKWVSSYTGTSPQTMVNQNRAPVVPGQKITATGHISLDKSNGGEPAGALLIMWYDKDGNLIRVNSSDVITKGDGGAFQEVTVTDVAPPGAAYATIGLSGNGNGAGAAVFDAISWDYRYIPTLAPGVIADTYTYDRDGNLVAQRNADGDTESWTRDTYGRITDHTDLSGATYHYTYDANSGLQTGETDNWAAVELTGGSVPGYVTGQTGTGNTETRTYTAAGLLASLSYGDGSSYTYGYDANGNQTRQEATTVDGNGKAVHTVTTTSYDSHNRISQVSSDDGSEVLTETTTYDAAGNRRSIDATVTAGGVQRSHTTSWYAYDRDNRVAVTDGDLVSGAIAVSSRSTSYAVTYDTVGNMVMRLTKSGANTLGQLNQYDNRGELVLAKFASALDGSNDRGVAETRTYDAGGNIIVDNQYYASGTTANQMYNPKTDPDSPDYIGHGAGGGTGANIGGYLSTATITRYDAFGRVSAEQTFGHDQFWNGTGGDTTPGPIPDENATTYAGMTLQTEVLYQGPGGSSAYDAMGNIVFYQYRVNSQRLDQYTVTYLKKEGYLESATSGVNVTNLPDVRPATDESYYDVRGNRIAIAQHTEYGNGTVADTVRVFAYDGNNQIISRRDGTASGSTIDQGSSPGLNNQHYVYANGQQVAHYDESTTVDVLSEVTAFSNSNGSGDYVVQQGDTLKSIAQAVYGNASLWYIVAQANALNGDADLAVGLSLSIPAVTTSKNDSTTFKPYNPSEIQGSTTPNLPVIAPPPPPPKQHCNVIAAIVIIAVVVVASIFTAGAAAYALSAEVAAGAGAVGTAGASVLAGSAVLGLTTGEVAAAAAIGGFVGNAAGQLAGDALGTQKGFSFGEALTGGLTAGATAGLGSVLQGSATFSELATNGSTVLNTAGKVALATGSYAAQNASAEIAGQDHHFSWAGVVASAASAFVPSSLHLPSEQDSLAAIGDGAEDSFLGDVAGSAVAGGVQREVSRALGDDHTASWESIGENAVGSALGRAAVGAVVQQGSPRQSGYRFDFTAGGVGVAAEDSLAGYPSSGLPTPNGLNGGSMWPQNPYSPLSLYGQPSFGDAGTTTAPTSEGGTQYPAAVSGSGDASTGVGGYSVPESLDGIDPASPGGKELISQLYANTAKYVNYLNAQQGQTYAAPPDTSDPTGLVEYNHALQKSLYEQQSVSLVVTPGSAIEQDAETTAESREDSAQYFNSYRTSPWGDLLADSGTILTDGGNSLIGAGKSAIDIVSDYQSFRQVATGATMAVAHPLNTYNSAVEAATDWFALPLDQQARGIGDAGISLLTFGGVDAAAAKTIGYAGDTISAARSLSSPGALDTSFLEAPQGEVASILARDPAGDITAEANQLSGKKAVPTSGSEGNGSLQNELSKYSYTLDRQPSDLAVNSRGVYGYLPTEDSPFASSKWPVDWTDPEQVANAQSIRLQYHAGIQEETDFVATARAQGFGDDEIAPQIVDLRNQSRLSYYTEDQLPTIYARNVSTYGNMFGPSYEMQLAKYGTPQAVIEAGSRTNPSMDVLTGIARVRGE